MQRLIRRFSPAANAAQGGDDGYDVLVATDAHGVGLNMQYASAVVN